MPRTIVVVRSKPSQAFMSPASGGEFVLEWVVLYDQRKICRGFESHRRHNCDFFFGRKRVLMSFSPDRFAVRASGLVLYQHTIARLCYVGYSQTVSGVFNSGITLQRTPVSSVGHSYPYPELLEVLYDIYTRTRNFRKFCTPVRTIPRVGVQHFIPARNFRELSTTVPQ